MNIWKEKLKIVKLLKQKKETYELIKDHKCKSFIHNTMLDFDIRITKLKKIIKKFGGEK